MDVRAFGSIYGQTSSLPYASGYTVNASGTNTRFPACRGFYVETSNKTIDSVLVCTLADSPASPVTLSNIRNDALLPWSITSISGTSTVARVTLLY